MACGLAAWGWWQPMKTAAPDAAAAVLWLSMAVVVATLHLAAAATLLGGSIYLAFGRLLGTRACSACGWQAMIIERLPEAAVATAVTAVGTPGTVAGVTATEALEAEPVPAELVAVTVNV